MMAKDRQLRVRVPAELVDEIVAWALERHKQGDRTMVNLDGTINVSAASRTLLAVGLADVRRRRA